MPDKRYNSLVLGNVSDQGERKNKMERLIRFVKRYQELVSYSFWGVTATIISWGSYSIFAMEFEKFQGDVTIFGAHISSVVLIANVLSWICAVAFAFVTNKLWVFHSKSWDREVFLPELSKFIGARFITGMIEIVAVPLLESKGLNQTIFNIEGMVAKVVVSLSVVVLNYIFSKRLIFKNPVNCQGENVPSL